MPNPLSKEEFIKRSLLKHGDLFDYSKAKFVNTSIKVEILCPEHGSFWQSPRRHYEGGGCSKCSGKYQPCSGEFVVKCKKIHGDKYDYSQLKYVNKKTKVEVTCPLHGGFQLLPGNHLAGQGCPFCSSHKNLQDERGILQRLDECREIHEDKYSYGEVGYQSAELPVVIICPIHGRFEQLLHSHLDGHGCDQCARVLVKQKTSSNTADFVQAAKAKQGATYDYSQVVYTNSKNKVEISCTKLNHGPFWQTPHGHLRGHGCPTCVHLYSQPHKDIEAYLRELGVDMESNTRKIIPPLELDIFVPKHSLAVEFNGKFWHSLDESSLPKEKLKHLVKFQECANLGITLIQVDEHEWINPVVREVWKSVIAAKVGLNKRIFARKTKFEVITYAIANEFLRENHLQGATTSIRWAFGLRHGTTLVGVITFSNHQKRELNLTRMAFLRGVTIVGGASKLFHNALQYLPLMDIVTFSNNRYSNGGVYPLMGFRKQADLRPSYQWVFRNKVWNKRLLRKDKLKKIGIKYDKLLTEHQNLYRSGARCLYDAGYQRWVYNRKT